jgi:hypothetical protein
MISNLFGVYEAEVLDVQEKSKKYPHTLYTLKIGLANGIQSIVKNAVSATGSFGGIFDYLQVQHRPTIKGTYTFKGGGSQLQTIGERVLVAFISGDIRRPVIVAGLSHPLAGNDLPDPNTEGVQATLQVAGMSFQIWPSGKFTVTHKGAPEVSEGSETTGQDAANVTVFIMDDDGSWRFVDSEKQTVACDRTGKTITISNGDDSLVLSKDDHKLTVVVTGETEATLSKDVKVTAEQKVSVQVTGDVELKSDGIINVDGSGAKAKFGDGKVAFGSDTTELLKLISDLLQEMQTAAPTFVNTAYGPGVLNAKLMSKIIETKTKLDAITNTF